MIVCYKCGHSRKDLTNFFGTFCPQCYDYIPPNTEIEYISKNKKEILLAQEKVREYIKKKIIGDAEHAN